MENINDILNYLQKDLVKNINMINFMNDYPVSYIEKVGNSVIAKGRSDRNWVYISSDSKEELEAVKEKLKIDDKCFAIIEDWMIPILTKGSKIKWELSTMRFFVPKDILLPDIKHATSDLKTDDADFIYQNSDYKEYISVEYVKDRIKKGLSSGIHSSGKLAAWCITQDDGAVGFLHVLPEYRKKGYGKSVTLDVIKKIRNEGKLPFAHIEQENENSIKLAKSLGFKEDRSVNWFEIE
ncbi:GNAT family N-acetyltransferase [Acidilutibacter cellobiosedens]|jgi:8-oxo-dGTP diphosphatase|uniref:GNAT family N-acetyltransferase n=1 Tax=Acidilutibacter cellobiosedens TaxID=2507161 RepID=A0A410QE91_9FIRM|nr:GNAT family N-acetyltransferase [Acidilutibacter cellobiosedens]MBE6083434.1 GNAT family N-acetyltransferase [Tissierellaceae bacterium]QAT62343.1 GNAT family N-acetyltransferase [Acidilutibacter cellobiosedens]